MSRHLLKCECGNELPVRATQAGDQTICPECKQTVSVPSLRELTSLPPADAKPKNKWAVLPERSLPTSMTGMIIGGLLLIVAVTTPLLVAMGLFDNAFSYTDPSDPRRTFFRLENMSFWGGIAMLALVGCVSLFRGLGFPITGGARERALD